LNALPLPGTHGRSPKVLDSEQVHLKNSALRTGTAFCQPTHKFHFVPMPKRGFVFFSHFLVFCRCFLGFELGFWISARRGSGSAWLSSRLFCLYANFFFLVFRAIVCVLAVFHFGTTDRIVYNSESESESVTPRAKRTQQHCAARRAHRVVSVARMRAAIKVAKYLYLRNGSYSF